MLVGILLLLAACNPEDIPSCAEGEYLEVHDDMTWDCISQDALEREAAQEKEVPVPKISQEESEEELQDIVEKVDVLSREQIRERAKVIVENTEEESPSDVTSTVTDVTEIEEVKEPQEVVVPDEPVVVPVEEEEEVVVVESQVGPVDQIIDAGYVGRVPVSDEAPDIVQSYGRAMSIAEEACQLDCLGEEFQWSGLNGAACWCGYQKEDGSYLKFLLRE